jgi:hypothetical protein
VARVYGSFSIWFSNRLREKRKADMILNNMSDEEFYESYKNIRHLVNNSKVLNRLSALDKIYG